MNRKNEIISEQELNKKICEAWNKLDVEVIAPYLADNLTYESLYWDNPITNKEEVLKYLKEKFKACVESSDKMHAEMEDENGVMKPVLRGSYSPAVYDMAVENGMITKLLIRPAYFRFKFENLDDDYPALVEIAANSLQNYFTQDVKKTWGWLQSCPTQVRFQDLCIAYNQYVLCICVGMIRKTLEDGQQIFVNQQELQALRSECEQHHMTPCLFLIDANGNPFNDGCHLIDARTFEPVELDNLKDDNEGRMSDWECHNLGVMTVCNLLAESGYTDIDHCDVLHIDPQVFFKDGECLSFVYVRSIPSGCEKQKYYIQQKDLDRLTKGGLKGYFVDIRWANVFGGSGMFNEDYLFRGSQLQDPKRNMKMNLMHNELQLIDIDKAIEELPFIEVVDEV